MPSETHLPLYRQLQEVTARIEAALAAGSYEVLPPLLDEQGKIMRDLDAAGPCTDVKLLALLTETRDRVMAVIPAIQKQRNDIAEQIGAGAMKKKLNKAYGD